MAKNKRTMIVVADAGRAHVFVNDSKEGTIEPVQAFENAAVHLRSREIGSDRPGRSVESVGSAHHAEEPRSDPHRLVKAAFAKQMADYVERGAVEKQYDHLVLVAPPQMLGDLREVLGENAAAKVTREVAKDLTKIPAAELAARLRELVRA